MQQQLQAEAHVSGRCQMGRQENRFDAAVETAEIAADQSLTSRQLGYTLFISGHHGRERD